MPSREILIKDLSHMDYELPNGKTPEQIINQHRFSSHCSTGYQVEQEGEDIMKVAAETTYVWALIQYFGHNA